MYNSVCRALRSQFQKVSEERDDTMVRRVFVTPGQAMATASFLPGNASGGQIVVDIALQGS